MAAACLLAAVASAQPRPAASAPANAAPPAPQFDVGKAEVHVLHVQGNVYMLVGAGGNIAVQAGDEGVLVVDTGIAGMSDKILAAIRSISPKPIRYIVNTHVHPDHIGNNQQLAAAGKTVTGGPGMAAVPGGQTLATIISHNNVLDRMTAAKPAIPSAAWPIDTYTSGQKEVYYNGEPVQIMYQPAAHTDGDSMVFFRHSDVIAAGDIFLTTGYPFIDMERGGSVQGIIEGLNRMLEIAIPKHEQEGGTYIIPGHGRLCDEADLVEYRDMVTIIRDRVQAGIKKGQTLEQVKAAKLTRDYDARYGATTGFWTTDMFVEAVYKSLTAKK